MKDHSDQFAPFDAAVSRHFSKAKAQAARVGVCARTIRRWAAAGCFPAYKLNARVIVFDDREVDAYVAAQKAPIHGCQGAR